MTTDLEDPDRAIVERSVATRHSELEGASWTGDTSQAICHLKKATVNARTLNVPTFEAQLLQFTLRNFSSLVA